MKVGRFPLVTIFFILFLVISYFLFFKNIKLYTLVKNFLENFSWIKKAEEMNRDVLNEKSKEMENGGIEKNVSNETANESYQVDKSTQISATENESYIKPLTLKIIDICSGKFENVFSISEGTRKCLNSPSPYDILLEKNSTHIVTSILNDNGFNETFEISDTILIYFLFAEDVASVTREIEKIYLDGSDYFYVGEYELQTIWEADSSGNLYISKMIAVLPLYVKKNITEGNYTLTFYLRVFDKDFYIGKINFYCKGLM